VADSSQKNETEGGEHNGLLSMQILLLMLREGEIQQPVSFFGTLITLVPPTDRQREKERERERERERRGKGITNRDF